MAGRHITILVLCAANLCLSCNSKIVVCAPQAPASCACDGGLPGVQTCNERTGTVVCECQDARLPDASVVFDNPDVDGGVDVGRQPGFASVDRTDACATTTAEARPGEKIDVIFVIDNSGSMDTEIAAVRSNINRNFANIIAASGVDFRVIMISQFGDGGQNVCVEPPLSGAPCSAGLEQAATNRFFHYDTNIQSTDPWCQLLETFDAPDRALLAPDGWGQWLREEARKLFVVITDDSAGCVWPGPDGPVNLTMTGEDPIGAATTFHRALLARSPTQFGVPPDVRYSWYSIIGVKPNAPLSAPWFPHDPIDDDICATAASPGTAYQALSIMTDALRYPVCEGLGFESVFRALSRGVIRTAKAACSFALPDETSARILDTATITVEYKPGGADTGQRLPRAETSEACDGDGFYFQDDKIVLCPSSCATVRADDSARVEVLFGCGTGGPT